MAKLFQIYRASAGSGKTRTLAKEYLKLALRFRSDYFKHILAVTFTNKSTQEMKNRIMHYLNEFVNGEPNELAAELQQELGLDPQTFKSHAQEVQAAILHDYGNFSISTIDAFFQRVIRSFTREAGISGDYRLEVDDDLVMEEVIGNLIDELGERPDLTRWVVELALQNLENDKSWDMRSSLAEFSKEIFREEFRPVEEGIRQQTENKNYFTEALRALQKKKYEFINFTKSKARSALGEFQLTGLGAGDFKYNGGIYNFFSKISEINTVKDFDERAKGSRVDNEFQSAKNWPAKDHPRTGEIIRLADEKWIGLLNEILDYRRKNFEVDLSAEVALSNFYAFGLLSDIARKLSEYKRENNLMLLADAPQFLNGIIQNSDTPFIFEKAGSFYRNFLIDEFQDTSGLQWKNFRPLLINGLDSGYPSLIVGDVKQAIYRWRGGDQSLLQEAVEGDLGKDRTEKKTLNKNFRSANEIVSFNNALFKSVSTIASLENGRPISANEYQDVEQLATQSKEGFVQVRFFADFDDLKWKDEAQRQMVLDIEGLQKSGARPSDIAILVRTNWEGQDVVSYLLEHKNSGNANPECRYDVVSSESLRIDSAGSVNLVVAALTYLLYPDDPIARAQLAYENARLHDLDKSMAAIFAVANPVVFESSLPPAFTERKIFLRKLSLFELTETLIEIFELGKVKGELSYLLAFQDQVLEFANRERNDLRAFLDWWMVNKEKKSIVAPLGAEAMQLFTLHKAKGLQFKYVIVPFCSWGLDHDGYKSPNLWVKSTAPVFRDIGYMPVRYGSGLKESLFAKEYETEHASVYLDNLNLLYVALTRAELGLFIFAPDSKVRIHKNSVARLVYDGIKGAPALAGKWNAADQMWSSGLATALAEMKTGGPKTISLDTYNTSQWREKLIIKKTAPHLANANVEQRQKINYGIHLHAAFSKIDYADDILTAINSLESEGIIDSGERQELEKAIHKLMENTSVADWFSSRWEVHNEAHTLMPGGKEYRIDRLLVNGKQAIVIDYKTGSPKKEDQKQVGEYCMILKQMGLNAEGYLLYLAEGEVVSVVPPKPPKRKNQNQLGLDF
ncbi:MAG TPA: UvrD-helicase domain-containing protein [Cyclobacteriaceae bacterium]|nr:UvrD-helicase domain-containing protein [Cyclobacteriaceae bacterium]